MKIILLGPNGQLGWELQRALAPLGDVIALGRSGTAPGLSGDLADLAGLTSMLRELEPDVVVNAAAYTAVDKAESDAEQAELINALAPGVIAQEQARRSAWLLHYSTDYVFDGSGDQPRDEAAPTAPLSVYGRSKLAGEEAIRASGCRHLILRTSWVHAARGGNFARTMLRLAAERDALRVVDDQIGAPTGADLLADVSAHALRVAMHSTTPGAAVHAPALSGTYHVSASGQTSWCGYARHVIDWGQRHGLALRASAENIIGIPSTDFPSPARRPLNSRLDTSKFRTSFGISLPPWQAGVDRMLAEALPTFTRAATP